jgi:hypothetical protein
MLFRIQRGGVEGVSPEPGRIVYLVSSTDALLDAGHACIFTDGNAAAAFTTFHDDSEQLAAVIDWPLMQARYWRNTPDDPDRRRRRCAEFLVHKAVPLDKIEELGVYDAAAQSSVGELVAAATSSVGVHIRSGWYF